MSLTCTRSNILISSESKLLYQLAKLYIAHRDNEIMHVAVSECKKLGIPHSLQHITALQNLARQSYDSLNLQPLSRYDDLIHETILINTCNRLSHQVHKLTYDYAHKEIKHALQKKAHRQAIIKTIFQWLTTPEMLTIAILLWAFYPSNPYAYYILLRFICCPIFAYLAYHAYQNKKYKWTWTIGLLAVLYNPLARIHLTREIWTILNIASIIVSTLHLIIRYPPPAPPPSPFLTTPLHPLRGCNNQPKGTPP